MGVTGPAHLGTIAEPHVGGGATLVGHRPAFGTKKRRDLLIFALIIDPAEGRCSFELYGGSCDLLFKRSGCRTCHNHAGTCLPHADSCRVSILFFLI